MMKRFLFFIVYPFLFLGSTGSDASPIARESAPIEKVIFISIDTLRADALGSYNPKSKATPELDRFAANSVICKDVTSQSATTAPSHKSILYSLYPGIHKTSIRGIPRETLISPVEVLRSNGYRTAAITGGGQLSRIYGFSRGFETYWQPQTSLFAKQQLEQIRQQSFEWLDRHAKDKFFLFLHTYEVHCPYNPPPEFFQKWAGWYKGPMNKATCYPDLQLGRRPMPTDYEYLRNLYSAQVNYVDMFLGQLFKKLKALGIFDRTLIVFLSDHGESLGERGYIGHNQLFQVQLRVPLLMHIPGVAPVELDAPIETLDVMPTLFELLGIRFDSYPVQGRSIVSLLKNQNRFDTDRALISEQLDRARVRVGPFAVVFSKDGKLPDRLYNLQTDPHEMEDISSKHPEIVRRLKQTYFLMLTRNQKLASRFVLEPGKKPHIDEQTYEQLKTLGYLAH